MASVQNKEPKDPLGEARAAYQAYGIKIAEAATYGVYSRLRCERCGAMLGAIGDRLIPGLLPELLKENFDLYAAGLLGCKCGHQAERARAVDPARADAAIKRFAALH
jgi:hypothetical protein